MSYQDDRVPGAADPEAVPGAVPRAGDSAQVLEFEQATPLNIDASLTRHALFGRLRVKVGPGSWEVTVPQAVGGNCRVTVVSAVGDRQGELECCGVRMFQTDSKVAGWLGAWRVGVLGTTSISIVNPQGTVTLTVKFTVHRLDGGRAWRSRYPLSLARTPEPGDPGVAGEPKMRFKWIEADTEFESAPVADDKARIIRIYNEGRFISAFVEARRPGAAGVEAGAAAGVAGDAGFDAAGDRIVAVFYDISRSMSKATMSQKLAAMWRARGVNFPSHPIIKPLEGFYTLPSQSADGVEADPKSAPFMLDSLVRYQAAYLLLEFFLKLLKGTGRTVLVYPYNEHASPPITIIVDDAASVREGLATILAIKPNGETNLAVAMREVHERLKLRPDSLVPALIISDGTEATYDPKISGPWSTALLLCGEADDQRSYVRDPNKIPLKVLRKTFNNVLIAAPETILNRVTCAFLLAFIRMILGELLPVENCSVPVALHRGPGTLPVHTTWKLCGGHVIYAELGSEGLQDPECQVVQVGDDLVYVEDTTLPAATQDPEVKAICCALQSIGKDSLLTAALAGDARVDGTGAHELVEPFVVEPAYWGFHCNVGEYESDNCRGRPDNTRGCRDDEFDSGGDAVRNIPEFTNPLAGIICAPLPRRTAVLNPSAGVLVSLSPVDITNLDSNSPVPSAVEEVLRTTGISQKLWNAIYVRATIAALARVFAGSPDGRIYLNLCADEISAAAGASDSLEAAVAAAVEDIAARIYVC